MFKSYFKSKKWAMWAWGGATLLLSAIGCQVWIVALINDWYKVFYDLLQQAGTIDATLGMAQFWKCIKDFCYLAAPYMLLASAVKWFARMYSIRWREAMTASYLKKWVKVKKDIEGSSQRIQEDCMKWADTVSGLGLQFIKAIFTLLIFVPLLYTMLGWMVWVAIGCAAGGMILSWLIGWFLPGLELNAQVTEAAFRKELVLGEDDKVKHGSLREFASLFTGLRLNHERLYKHYGYFDCWTEFFSQGMSILPYLVAAPILMSGAMTLGGLIQLSNAFGKVYGSMAIFIENWVTITAGRSVYKRLKQFQDNVDEGDTDG